MNIITVNAMLESNVLRCSRNGFRLTYDLMNNQRAVIARSEKHALVIGDGTLGVGMVWVDDEEARGLVGYQEALRLVEDAVGTSG